MRKAQDPQKVLKEVPQRWYCPAGYAQNPKKPLHIAHPHAVLSLDPKEDVEQSLRMQQLHPRQTASFRPQAENAARDLHNRRQM
jgi:cytochrome P450